MLVQKFACCVPAVDAPEEDPEDAPEDDPEDAPEDDPEDDPEDAPVNDPEDDPEDAPAEPQPVALAALPDSEPVGFLRLRILSHIL